MSAKSFTLRIDTHAHIYPERFQTDWAKLALANLGDDVTSPVGDTLFAIALLRTDSNLSFTEMWQASIRCHAIRSMEFGFEITTDQGRLFVVEGRQWKTNNNLELVTYEPVDLEDGLSLAEMVAEIPAGQLAVVPWGAGKWLGSRGQEVARVVLDHPKVIRLGDNGGRPTLWRDPLLNHAQLHGLPVFLGSDPLPTLRDHSRIGTCGVELQISDIGEPVQRFLEALRNPSPDMRPFGRHSGMLAFVRNQLDLR